MPWLITPAQLEKFRKSQKSVIILDASWHLPTAERDAKKEFIEKHIIGAHFLDLDLFHDVESPLPNTLIQDSQMIGQKLSSLGIRDDYKIIFYDNSELHSACRALWMFRIFGHNPHQLYILDGGLAAWEKASGKVESGPVTSTSKQYVAKVQPEFLRSLMQMKNNVKNPSEQVIDLRHPVRYAGGADPRPNMRPGHIPGSYCFPYTSFFDADGRFYPPEKLRRLLYDIGADVMSPIISTCGAGMTAPILNFVLELLGNTQHALYDGSWAEWGQADLFAGEVSLDERPVETCLEN